MKKRFCRKTVYIPTQNGKMKLLVFAPLQSSPKSVPGVLWIHGGGFISGMPGMIHFSRGIDFVKKFGAVVITPEYRLAPKAPYPAALEDCYAALLYLKNNAAALGVRTDQIIVGGESAGGSLATAVCLYAHDRKDVNIAFHTPLYPMIDDRDTPSSSNNNLPLWNTYWNHKGWDAYLGSIRGGDVPSYAAPARRENFSGLPPIITFVGDRECFFCETLDYVENFKKSGIPAVVDVYHAPVHGFDMLLPFLKVSKSAVKNFRQHVKYALDHYFAPQNEKE